MTLQIVKNDSKELTMGERSLLNKLIAIYSDYEKQAYLYIQPNIGRLIPDFILIDPEKGISILEVKDWSIQYIRSINKKTAELQDRSDDNPVYKTKKYFDIAKGIISSSKDDMEFIEDNLYANTILTNISSKDIENTKIKKSLEQYPIKYITSDLIRKLKIDDLFSDEQISINENEMIILRTLFFPEIKIKKNNKTLSGKVVSTDIKALDIEQENFSKKLPYGHYMVTGIPGSGKTVILIARALHLIKENPTWDVQIMTYNNSLKNKIESILNSIAEDIKDNNFLNGIQIQNITVSTFHTVARRVANVTVPYKASQEWWNEVLPLLAIEKAAPRYDAVLIDEYQDFRDDWIRMCIKLCRECEYVNNSNKTVTGINLFLAGDRLQSIYNPKPHNWNKDFGINMAGRSKLLKTSYRSGKENTTLALQFLQQHEELEKEVNKFYKEEEELQMNLSNIGKSNPISFLEGGYESVVEAINNLIKEGYNYNDILLICHSKYDCNAITRCLPKNIKHNTVFVKEANDVQLKTCLLTSTYHSAKGIEGKVTILLDGQKFTEQLDSSNDIISRKLFYVGMTRASERLFIHCENYNKDSFAKIVKEIYNEKLVLA